MKVYNILLNPAFMKYISDSWSVHTAKNKDETEENSPLCLASFVTFDQRRGNKKEKTHLL